jgi:hypothetical protein
MHPYKYCLAVRKSPGKSFARKTNQSTTLGPITLASRSPLLFKAGLCSCSSLLFCSDDEKSTLAGVEERIQAWISMALQRNIYGDESKAEKYSVW